MLSDATPVGFGAEGRAQLRAPPPVCASPCIHSGTCACCLPGEIAKKGMGTCLRTCSHHQRVQAPTCDPRPTHPPMHAHTPGSGWAHARTTSACRQPHVDPHPKNPPMHAYTPGSGHMLASFRACRHPHVVHTPHTLPCMPTHLEVVGHKLGQDLDFVGPPLQLIPAAEGDAGSAPRSGAVFFHLSAGSGPALPSRVDWWACVLLLSGGWSRPAVCAPTSA